MYFHRNTCIEYFPFMPVAAVCGVINFTERFSKLGNKALQNNNASYCIIDYVLLVILRISRE